MKPFSARVLLAAVFIARGTSFLFSKQLLTNLSPMSILAVRFLLAFLVLALIFNKKIRQLDHKSLKGGIILGLLYTVCMTFEMYGLRLIDSGVSSLIENMAILFVPLYVAVLTKKFPKIKTIICALLAIIGVAFLSLTQFEKSNGALGIVLMICAALTYAACILVTEKVSKDCDALTVGIFQIGTMGFLSLIIALITKQMSLPHSQNEWIMLVFLVLICTCFGFAFQPLGQKYLPAENAAVLTVINPLTASIMGIIFAHELLSPLKIAGYIIILSTLYIYNSRLGEKNYSS